MDSLDYQENVSTQNEQITDHQSLVTANLIPYLLHLADNSLIIGHRNSEWTGHGPVLEQDIAISNIALDLIGQSRHLYQYAAELINQHGHQLKSEMPEGRPITEDDLAFLRDAWDFKNCLLVEQPNGDWGQTILHQFFFSAYQSLLFTQLQHSKNQQLAAIAEKSLKETTYHLRWSSDWVIRLGDGTEESHNRMLHALNETWMFTGELFEMAPFETALAAEGIGVDIAAFKEEWQKKVSEVFDEATLPVPTAAALQSGGKKGVHSEHLGFILAEMQFLQRAYPNASW
ncbi:1,2-phenylacetyl-CoA epoxidase subunit PaaC [Aridibaculum aurantiacum]|uniref:1,2-phenylacetyl-CoA epoxidase subunit PaaC n=1 Tax=Aridibaculum aurantiacum TaxID=2810307 RepID=UPI001A9791C2|nr:1,2-phenylacetyl-CoA epoxidase subunit PaaC [Aridibaculum aurantiacum]